MRNQPQHSVTIGEDDIWLIIRNRQARSRRLNAAMQTFAREVNLNIPNEVYVAVEEAIENHDSMIGYLTDAMD